MLLGHHVTRSYTNLEQNQSNLQIFKQQKNIVLLCTILGPSRHCCKEKKEKERTKIFLFSRSMLCPPLLPCLGSSRQGEEDDDNDDGGNDGYEESDKNGV